MLKSLFINFVTGLVTIVGIRIAYKSNNKCLVMELLYDITLRVTDEFFQNVDV